MTESGQDRAARRRHYATVLPPAARRGLALALVGTVVVAVVETVSVVLLVPLMEVLTGQRDGEGVSRARALLGQPSDTALIYWLVGAVLGGFILKDIFTVLFRWWLFGFINKQQVATSEHILDYFLHAPYEVHLSRSAMDRARSVMDAVVQFYGRTVGGWLSLVAEAISLVAIGGALLVLRPVLTLALAAYFAVIALVLSRVVKGRAKEAGEEQFTSGLAAYQAILHGLGSVADVKIRHSQPHFVQQFRVAAMRNARANRIASMTGELPKYVFEVFLILGLAVTIGVSMRAGEPKTVLPTLALLAAGAFRILPSLTRMTSSLTMIRAGEAARTALLQELADEERTAAPSSRTPSVEHLPFRRAIDIEDLSFRYPGTTRYVLRHVDLRIERGSSVALVGGSGAGKTTLANLILGLQSPTAGRILVDGHDVAQAMDRWQNDLAFVPQDVFHLDATLAENIAFDVNRADIDPDRLAAAVQRAQLSDLVADLPDGLETQIGDRGTRLSGGQRQRIGIARALFREPEVLVLDEATSALDNETERRITQTIHALRGEMTIIVIAHRLSTVRDCDEIFLLSEGRVAHRGTFDDLVTSSPEFRHWVELGTLLRDEPDGAANGACDGG